MPIDLTARAVLDLWDQGRDPHLTGPERALVLAAAACPDSEAGSLAALPVGRVTALALRLRESIWGPSLAATVDCPRCGTEVEFEADAEALLDLEAKIEDHPGPLLLGEHAVVWRPPSYGDLAALSHAPDVDPGDFLTRRCVVEARHGDDPVEALPASVTDALSEAIAGADPLAEVLVDLTCPECGEAFGTALDLPAFVWAELESRGQRLLVEVDALARTYGWSEEQVLSLSEARRERYLAMVTEEPM